MSGWVRIRIPLHSLDPPDEQAGVMVLLQFSCRMKGCPGWADSGFTTGVEPLSGVPPPECMLFQDMQGNQDPESQDGDAHVPVIVAHANVPARTARGRTR